MDDVEEGWNRGETYIMKADGLYDMNGEPANDWKREHRNNKKGIEVNEGGRKVTIDENGVRVEDDADYRYEKERHEKAVDSIKSKRDNDLRKIEDSLNKAKEKLDEEFKKLKETKDKPSTAGNDFVLPSYNPVLVSILSK